MHTKKLEPEQFTQLFKRMYGAVYLTDCRVSFGAANLSKREHNLFLFPCHNTGGVMVEYGRAGKSFILEPYEDWCISVTEKCEEGGCGPDYFNEVEITCDHCRIFLRDRSEVLFVDLGKLVAKL